MVQDEAGRELMATLAKLNSKIASSVLQYIGLFRPAKSDLNNGRALKLLTETLELTPNLQLLAAGCDATVRNIHNKRQQGETVKPLTNHNYLKQVLTGLKEQFNHPVNGMKSSNGSRDMGRAQVKQSHQLSDAENERLRQEMLAKFKLSKPTGASA
jgi:hypothetical protein